MHTNNRHVENFKPFCSQEIPGELDNRQIKNALLTPNLDAKIDNDCLSNAFTVRSTITNEESNLLCFLEPPKHKIEQSLVKEIEINHLKGTIEPENMCVLSPTTKFENCNKTYAQSSFIRNAFDDETSNFQKFILNSGEQCNSNHKVYNTTAQNSKICDISFDNSIVKPSNAKDIISTTPHVCSICGKTYQNVATLKNHIRKHTSGEIISKRFKCAYCMYSSQYNRNIVKHTSLMHTNIDNLLPTSINTTLDKNANISSLQLTVPVTLSEFVLNSQKPTEPKRSSQSIADLLSSNSPSQENINVSSLSQTNLFPQCSDAIDGIFKPKLPNVSPGTFSLNSNYEFFETDTQLNSPNHIKQFINNPRIGEPYKCALCEKTYKTKQKLVFHMDRHDNRKKFTCSVFGCERAFRTPKYLRNHINDYHGQMKDYRCSVANCEFVGNRRAQLKRHMLDMHAGKKMEHQPRLPSPYPNNSDQPNSCISSSNNILSTYRLMEYVNSFQNNVTKNYLSPEISYIETVNENPKELSRVVHSHELSCQILNALNDFLLTPEYPAILYSARNLTEYEIDILETDLYNSMHYDNQDQFSLDCSIFKENYESTASVCSESFSRLPLEASNCSLPTLTSSLHCSTNTTSVSETNPNITEYDVLFSDLNDVLSRDLSEVLGPSHESTSQLVHLKKNRVLDNDDFISPDASHVYSDTRVANNLSSSSSSTYSSTDSGNGSLTGASSISTLNITDYSTKYEPLYTASNENPTFQASPTIYTSHIFKKNVPHISTSPQDRKISGYNREWLAPNLRGLPQFEKPTRFDNGMPSNYHHHSETPQSLIATDNWEYATRSSTPHSSEQNCQLVNTIKSPSYAHLLSTQPPLDASEYKNSQPFADSSNPMQNTWFSSQPNRNSQHTGQFSSMYENNASETAIVEDVSNWNAHTCLVNKWEFDKYAVQSKRSNFKPYNFPTASIYSANYSPRVQQSNCIQSDTSMLNRTPIERNQQSYAYNKHLNWNPLPLCQEETCNTFNSSPAPWNSCHVQQAPAYFISNQESSFYENHGAHNSGLYAEDSGNNMNNISHLPYWKPNQHHCFHSQKEDCNSWTPFQNNNQISHPRQPEHEHQYSSSSSSSLSADIYGEQIIDQNINQSNFVRNNCVPFDVSNSTVLPNFEESCLVDNSKESLDFNSIKQPNPHTLEINSVDSTNSFNSSFFYGKTMENNEFFKPHGPESYI